eukprot:TRINITY_DN16626_c0_g2_i1.p1 TRINITY_DN16626_c0_g2~~TRINITY_DN16626_c0_g2_i1.p1  ORF type:complete len:129 (-),score=21.16 TRINITY_DN16626_c0_g2_i1:9-395(-)
MEDNSQIYSLLYNAEQLHTLPSTHVAQSLPQSHPESQNQFRSHTFKPSPNLPQTHLNNPQQARNNPRAHARKDVWQSSGSGKSEELARKGLCRGLNVDPVAENLKLSLIHICRCRRYAVCRSRWSPYH